jgi:hypothetical protein
MACYGRYRRHEGRNDVHKQKQKEPEVSRLSGAVVADFLRAESRVKGKPYARTNVMRWLLDFSFRDSAGFSLSDWHAVQWEALVFAYDADKDSVLPGLPLPTKQELIQIQHWLLDLWSCLNKGDRVPIQTWPPARMLIWQDGKLHDIGDPLSVPWSEAFKARTYEISTAGEVGNRFCFCQECSRPYCARKRQAYCSSACSQKHRTREWRQKNPAEFRAARRAAYKRKVEALLGRPVKIATRSKLG